MQSSFEDCTRNARQQLVVILVLLALCGVTLMLARTATAGAPLEGGASGTSVTTTPTPTCCNGISGNINSYCDGGDYLYRYTYGLTSSCSITVTGNGLLSFQVSPNSTGPWTSPIHLDYAEYRVPPGYSERSGSLWSGPLPPGNNWFRYQFSLYGECWALGITSAPQPACVGGTITPVTATRTPTSTPTYTPMASPTATGCQLRFSDVTQGSTFYESVLCLACQGIVSGYSDGTFRPHSEVTRGQLAKIVSNAGGFNEPVVGQTFEDVPQSNTFYVWIERLTGRGHMTGYMCGGVGEPCVNGDRPYFRPGANATRAQTSKIVANTAGYSEIPTNQTFEDVPPTHTFYIEIQRLASRSIMSGYPCGGPSEPCLSGKPYFRPANNVTRGQSAKIVVNTLYPNCQTP